MSIEIPVSVGKVTYLPDGSKVEAAERFQRRKKGGNTAVHEAKHVIAAKETGTRVKSVTIIPGPGYLGLTELAAFNSIAALAPDADGMEGTSHDVFIAASAGADLSASRSAAKAINIKKAEYIEAVSDALEENLTLNEPEIDKVMDEVDKGKIVDITTRRTDGEMEKSEVRAKNNIVMFPFVAREHKKTT